LQRQLSGDIPDWDRLEEELIQADFGVHFSTKFVEKLRQTRGGLLMAGSGLENARDELENIFRNAPKPELKKPVHVVLLLGVNGVGKTTSAAKLANYWVQKKKRVRLVAADTFRAAAIEQLKTWGERIRCPVTSGAYGMDPAALAHRAVEEALAEETQVLIIDTAGRQANKINLMQELAKIPRVIKKLLPDAPHETLLVIDAHTGSNAHAQARQFSQSLPITGLIATKMDGSANGGSLVAIASEFGLLPQWVGTGERLEDFKRFEAREFLDQLFDPLAAETEASA
jgi:signal recognition particle-docking protein FtsY